jgi:hypothetical protein
MLPLACQEERCFEKASASLLLSLFVANLIYSREEAQENAKKVMFGGPPAPV